MRKRINATESKNILLTKEQAKFVDDIADIEGVSVCHVMRQMIREQMEKARKESHPLCP